MRGVHRGLPPSSLPVWSEESSTVVAPNRLVSLYKLLQELDVVLN